MLSMLFTSYAIQFNLPQLHHKPRSDWTASWNVLKKSTPVHITRSTSSSTRIQNQSTLCSRQMITRWFLFLSRRHSFNFKVKIKPSPGLNHCHNQFHHRFYSCKLLPSPIPYQDRYIYLHSLKLLPLQST